MPVKEVAWMKQAMDQPIFDVATYGYRSMDSGYRTCNLGLGEPMPPVTVAVTCHRCFRVSQSDRTNIAAPQSASTNPCSAASSTDALACASMCDGERHQATLAFNWGDNARYFSPIGLRLDEWALALPHGLRCSLWRLHVRRRLPFHPTRCPRREFLPRSSSSRTIEAPEKNREGKIDRCQSLIGLRGRATLTNVQEVLYECESHKYGGAMRN
ncbi:hypothetical protein EI94DRAFT_1706185 [Lactarius quietus]|nr:hypothetical protein EI94DRAFT_1706185 [Lactarius quietus]